MSGRLAAFAGSTPNIGTSLTAFGTAYRIAALTGRKVGYLCLNLKSAKTHLYLGVDKPDVTLDGIRPELRAGTLTGDKLRQYAFRSPKLGGLHVLFGNMAREQAEYYEAEDMKQLLAASREAFDLTIADVSAYWDNAATVCAMAEADDRFLVTTDSLSHFQEDFHRWTGQVGSQFGMTPEQFRLVLLHSNHRSTGGFRMKEIRKETGCNDFTELRLAESVHLQLDSGRLDEWLASEERNAAAFDSVADPLLKQMNWSQRLQKTERPWLRRLMVHRRRGL
jgi:MinD-like ATPase involved in chromosome partitioning or flagellar assembly